MKIAWRQTAFRLAALLGSGLLVLAAGEIVCRVLVWRDRDTYEDFRAYQRSPEKPRTTFIDFIQPSQFPDMVYDFVPNASGPTLGETFPMPIRINSDGMRDREYPIPKPAGVIRIALLGDSVAFGWGVHTGDCCGKVLEDYLNRLAAPSVRFEVLNFSIPGYNAPMEVALYEHKARKYQPDVVLIHHVENDWCLPNFLVSRPNAFSLKESFLWDRLAGDWPRSRLVDAPELADAQGRLLCAFPEDRIPEPFRFLQGFGAVEAALDKLARMTRSDGAAVVQLLAPTILTPDDLKARQASALNYGPFLSYGANHGFRHIDATACLVDALNEFGLGPSNYWISPGRDWHPNEIGHLAIAWALLQGLSRQGVFGAALATRPDSLQDAWRAAMLRWIAQKPWDDVKRFGSK